MAKIVETQAQHKRRMKEDIASAVVILAAVLALFSVVKYHVGTPEQQAGVILGGTPTPTNAVQMAVAGTLTPAATATPTCVISTPDGTVLGSAPATADKPAGGAVWGGKTDADEQASFEAVYGQGWQQQWAAEHAKAKGC